MVQCVQIGLQPATANVPIPCHPVHPTGKRWMRLGMPRAWRKEEKDTEKEHEVEGERGGKGGAIVLGRVQSVFGANGLSNLYTTRTPADDSADDSAPRSALCHCTRGVGSETP